MLRNWLPVTAIGFDSIRAVEWIRRHPEYIEVKARGTEVERYDRVFLACHSDQALALLADPTPQERRCWGPSSTSKMKPCCTPMHP